MALKKITAIIRTDALEAVEHRLQGLDVPGITVSRVRGFGELAMFAKRDWMSTHARVEVFTDEVHEERIIDAILEEASSRTPGDGILAVTPVDHLYRIRDRCEVRCICGPAESHPPGAA